MVAQQSLCFHVAGGYGRLLLTLVCIGSIPQEKERLSVLEKRYHSLTGGRTFPKPCSTMKEVRERRPAVWDTHRLARSCFGGTCSECSSGAFRVLKLSNVGQPGLSSLAQVSGCLWVTKQGCKLLIFWRNSLLLFFTTNRAST